MKTTRQLFCLGLASLLSLAAWARPLDDFENGDHRDWVDFVPGLGGAVTEEFGILRIDVPAGLSQQSVWVATAKDSEVVPLDVSVELRVEVFGSASEKVFSVLAWLPESEPLAFWGGYFIACNGHEVLIGKGIHQHFLRETLGSSAGNEPIQLVLSLTPAAGQVTVRGQVRNLADGAVLFDRTVVDTAAADTLVSGTERRPAPYTGTGRFALLGYADGSEPLSNVALTFDNAEASTPAPANYRPVIRSAFPLDRSTSVPWSVGLLARATDVEEWLLEGSGILAPLGLPAVASTYGRGGDIHTVRSSAAVRTVPNRDYAGHWFALDPGGASNHLALHFDTFCEGNRVIEIEDYDFSQGQSIDLPLVVAEGSGPTPASYTRQTGAPGVDYGDQQGTATGVGYRPGDAVQIARSLDGLRSRFLAAGGPDTNVFDYDVRAMEAGDFVTFTRTFPPNDYHVFLRESVLNLDTAQALLERVMRDSNGQETSEPLGTFVALASGLAYRNVPLTDGSGLPVEVHLSGREILRLRQLTSAPAGTDIRQNYLVFAPENDLCATIESASSPDGPYVQDLHASFRGETVTIATEEHARFFRVTSPVRVTIVNLRRTGNTLLFDLKW